MSEDGACCACLVVKYNPRKGDDGLAYERWTCTTSGCEFVRAAALAECERECERLRDALKQGLVIAAERWPEMTDLQAVLAPPIRPESRRR